MSDLIVLVPDQCLSVYFLSKTNLQDGSGSLRLFWKGKIPSYIRRNMVGLTLFNWCLMLKVKRQAMIRNLYNQIPP